MDEPQGLFGPKIPKSSEKSLWCGPSKSEKRNKNEFKHKSQSDTYAWAQNVLVVFELLRPGRGRLFCDFFGAFGRATRPEGPCGSSARSHLKLRYDVSFPLT